MYKRQDGHYTPDLGLLKMDFLGLRTLDVLSIACRNIEERTGTKIVPEEIPTDDELAFKLMQSGNMDGLFQVEGALYVSLFKRLPPKQFSDVVASIALNRPGPLESGMVEDYIKAAKNPAAVHYYDDRLRPILEETHGTMVYQEQIMQISISSKSRYGMRFVLSLRQSCKQRKRGLLFFRKAILSPLPRSAVEGT